MTCVSHADLGRTDSETKSNVLGGRDAKFGIPASQMLDAYRKAKEKGATRFGMHMMTGSCVLEKSYWVCIPTCFPVWHGVSACGAGGNCDDIDANSGSRPQGTRDHV
jgi:hypothetical protein